MIFPQVSATEWQAKYKIEGPKHTRCENCRKRMTFSVPVAYNNDRGLKTPEHGCPENFDQYITVSVDRSEIESLKELMKIYKATK